MAVLEKLNDQKENSERWCSEIKKIIYEQNKVEIRKKKQKTNSGAENSMSEVKKKCNREYCIRVKPLEHGMSALEDRN